jgi:hypothetical protein
MPSVCADRTAVALEDFDFAVDREQLLDERTPEVQKSHRERAFVIGPQGYASSIEEFSEVRTQFDRRGRLTTTGGARLQQYARRNFAGTAKAFYIRETVIASESTNGLAFLFDEGEGRVRTGRIAEVFQFPINGVFPE